MTISLDGGRCDTGTRVPANGPGFLLAGDIGGTKIALAIFSAERGPRAPLARAQFPSAKYRSLGAVVQEFLSGAALPVERASFAVAGPVIAGSALVTHLAWQLTEAGLAAELRLRSVHLLNDLEAIAAATSALQPAECHALNPGKPVSGGSVAVIAPGTGLGEAFLTWNGTRYRAFPSEGGHADFAPATERQAGLLAHLRQRFGHVSTERVCSGPGLLTLYEYLRDAEGAAESPEIAHRLAGPGDRPRVIGEAALRRPDPDPLCRAALDLFVSILGAEAGNLALKVLATGGVYLAGGIPMRILPALEEGRFMEAFTAKGRLTEMLARMPVHVVTRRAALLGAALRGFERCSSA
jgi:glucokinase